MSLEAVVCWGNVALGMVQTFAKNGNLSLDGTSCSTCVLVSLAENNNVKKSIHMQLVTTAVTMMWGHAKWHENNCHDHSKYILQLTRDGALWPPTPAMLSSKCNSSSVSVYQSAYWDTMPQTAVSSMHKMCYSIANSDEHEHKYITHLQCPEWWELSPLCKNSAQIETSLLKAHTLPPQAASPLCRH